MKIITRYLIYFESKIDRNKGWIDNTEWINIKRDTKEDAIDMALRMRQIDPNIGIIIKKQDYSLIKNGNAVVLEPIGEEELVTDEI